LLPRGLAVVYYLEQAAGSVEKEARNNMFYVGGFSKFGLEPGWGKGNQLSQRAQKCGGFLACGEALLPYEISEKSRQ